MMLHLSKDSCLKLLLIYVILTGTELLEAAVFILNFMNITDEPSDDPHDQKTNNDLSVTSVFHQ